MDPSTPAPASSNAAASSSDQPPRNRNRRDAGKGQTDSSSKANKGSTAEKGSKDNRHHQNTRKKEKTDSSAAGVAVPPRAPRTIAATDPIDLQAGKTVVAPPAAAEAPVDDEDRPQCFICTENIVIFAVSDCNHRTCHLCSLRLRALYKTKNCAYCKADQSLMIFTRDAEKPFQEYDLKAMAFFDRKLNVYFEDQEMYEDTMVLLRFNCPDPTCEVACPDGWNQLKSHVKKTHKLMLCDLCVRHKKVFAHEHNLMTASQLMKHFKTGDAGQSNQNSAEPSGFKGHPECGFCKESFYGDDELFEHCKKNHEQCFLCLRRNIRHQYYDKYADLERHLHSEHFACMDPECLEKKFVVFDSELDLKGHEAEMHPHATHGQRTRLRDARKIDISFNYQSASDNSQGRRGGRNARSSGQGSRREEQASNQPQLTPHQIQQIALQQQMAEEHERRIQNESTEEVTESMSELSMQGSETSKGGKSMLRTRPPAGFGSSLSEPAPVRPQSSATSAAARVAANIQRTSSPRAPVRTTSPVVVSQSRTEWPAVSAAVSVPTASPAPRKPAGQVAPETLSKHAQLQDKVQQYLQGTSGSLSQFRTLTTQFRNSQIPANQFVASLSSLFGSDLDKTGKIVQGLYDVLDSETKKAEMMRNWRDFKTVQSQFPSLESTVTSNPTLADIVTPSTRRVLVIKSSGTTRGGSGHIKPKSTSTWDRAAAAASSLNRTSSPGSRTNTPVFYPTPQLNSSAAWSLPSESSAEVSNSNAPSSSTSAPKTRVGGSMAQSSKGPGATVSWAGIPQTSSGSNSPAPQFRPSSSSAYRPIVAADQFPSLVSQAPIGAKPTFGLLPMQKSRSQQDDTPNGWVTGWSSLSAEQEEEEEPTSGKKKKNKKKILFHVG
ncbi:E3 ubiquitin-protein ligase ZNF598 [Entomortierella parvispora]|uniref:RING-type E3 ubiquitin transferase n=1 Tax=Entomortierella parvispora TaxID=205924 RepID=A0A9P3HF45_9FUNG|nr:E3 ubiquitin-protein ligase ZNF598 [Entomortierella parvispora]